MYELDAGEKFWEVVALLWANTLILNFQSGNFHEEEQFSIFSHKKKKIEQFSIFWYLMLLSRRIIEDYDVAICLAAASQSFYTYQKRITM